VVRKLNSRRRVKSVKSDRTDAAAQSGSKMNEKTLEFSMKALMSCRTFSPSLLGVSGWRCPN
jgi:hypothetical protein